VHSLVPRLLVKRGVLVSNWGTAISYTVAEHAVLLTLAALRNLPLWPLYLEMPADRVARMGTRGLRGKRVGIHGFGGIAREVVDMLQGFKVDIFAYSAGVPSELFQTHGVRECTSLEELFSTSDVLIECEGLNASTRGSVSAPVLDELHDGAVFVNVGRGAVVDEAHLQRMAASGRVRVALDVFAMEPLKPGSPWLDIPAACISPHIGGPTADAGPICGEHGLQNVRRYLRGEAIEGTITLDLYDRSA
jgi:phosphoglycerate dehydrogenase-like enzyme